jgi:GST-like protein
MITLYSSPTGNGYRTSILLEELELPYSVIDKDVRVGAAKSADFRAVSPLGKIPAIADTDTASGEPICVAESLAIALYLVEKTGKLMPKTLEERARAWQWAAIVATGFGSAIPGIFFAKMLGAAAHAKLIAKYFADIDLCFSAMDAHLSQHRYLAGSTYSYADVLAAPLLPTAHAFEVDLERFPSVLRWRDEVFARPAVKAGMLVPQRPVPNS